MKENLTKAVKWIVDNPFMLSLAFATAVGLMTILVDHSEGETKVQLTINDPDKPSRGYNEYYYRR